MSQQSDFPPDPTALDLVATAHNEEECQKLIHRALDYGTNLESEKGKNNDNDDQNDGVPLLRKRTEECIRWLESSIAVVAESSLSSSSSSAFELIEDILVDCLWLCGSTSISLPWTSTVNQPFHPTVQALIEIAQALLLFFVSKMKTSDFARKLQENWFPVLLEAANLVNITTSNTNSSANRINNKNASGGSNSAVLGNADDLMKRLKQYNTVTNYKQQKYNLLQEESEGYSKILHYLYHCSDGDGGDDDKVGTLSEDGVPRTEDRNTNQKLTYLWQLIGTFELDPSRVIDLGLDVLESKLFCTSSFKYNEKNDCRKKEIDDKKSPPDVTKEIRWLLNVITDCSSDKIPALMRFKIENAKRSSTISISNANHSTSASTSTENPVLSSLLKTVAFLVRENLMDLRIFMEDYFEPTLRPDIEMAYGIYRKKERGRVIALSRVNLSGNSSGKEDPMQMGLSNKLKLAMGKLQLNDDVHNNDNRNHHNWHILSLLLILIQWGEWELVKPMLSSSLWSKLCCLMPESFGSAFLDITEERIKVDTMISTPNMNNENTNNVASLFQFQKNHSLDKESAAILGLVRVVRSISDPLSCIIQSGCIASRPVLFCHLCRHLRSLLKIIHEKNDYDASSNNNMESVPEEVFLFFNTFLVPSLSLFPSNPAVSTELWSVLKILSYEIRYKLYEGWEGSGLEKAALVGCGTGEPKPLPNVEYEMVAGKAARYALKRLSKDNIRDMSRQLAKTTHSHPLVVYATILSQIESYDNMVEVMVEAQRFVNPLGLDVLGYCILGRLSGTTGGGVNRNRLKEDGVHVSQWLQSLETFAGEFYKGRPFVEFRGLVFYVMERLKDGHVMELGMLRTLLKVAGGYSFADYSPAASLNETQLDGRSGSVTLKRETMSFGIVEKTSLVATNRIRSVLQTDGLGVTMLILIAQARDKIIFDSAEGAFKEVKLVGNLYDNCQVLMSILLDFLTDDDGKKCDKSNPNRPVAMYSKFLPSLEDLQSIYGLDMATAWFLCRPSVKTALQMNSESLQKSCLKRFELTDDVRISYSDSLPESALTLLTPQLFETFYMNTTSDIYCPEKLLLSEISRVEKEVVSKQLDEDLRYQKEHVESTLNGLNEKKVNFFASEEISREATKAFLIYCIYPRTTQSPDDAIYSSAIAFQLHKIQTPGFSIMHYFDELISIVSGALFGVTEAEAANLAILLCQTLKVMNEWRHEDGFYDKEVLGNPGSCMENNEDGETSVGPVSHKDFIHLYNKWQYTLGAALIGCLKSTEYIHIRTGLVVLSRLIDVFPTGPSLGNKLLKVLEPLQDESSSRPDIRASANAYGMMLAKARDGGKWVEENKAAATERAEKEKEAAEERKKKIEKSFRELERDSEKITAQIGTDDRRDRPRSALRDQHPHDRRPEIGRQTISDFTRMESGEVNGRDRRGEERDRRVGRDADRNTRDRDDDTGRRSNRDGVSRDDGRWARDGPPSRNAKVSRPNSPIVDRDIKRNVGGDDERWRRDGPPQRNPKRSRPSSPVDDRDFERSNLKRARTEEYSYSSRRGNSRSPEPSSIRSGRSLRRGNARR